MKMLLLEHLDPSAGGELVQELLEQAANEILYDLDERERPEVSPDGLIARTFRDNSIECSWCMGTGTTLVGRCLICDGTGSRLTGRGFRLVLQEMGTEQIRNMRALRMFEEKLAIVREFTDDEWPHMRQSILDQFPHLDPDDVSFPKERLEEQVELMQTFVDVQRGVTEDGARLVDQLRTIERIARTADQAIAYRIEEIKPKEEAPEERGPDTCDECGKPAVTWSVEGAALCKRHAYLRGLLRTEKPDPGHDTDPIPEGDDSGREGASRLPMTRPMRLIGGPLDGQLRSIPRGETRMVEEGHTYERRGHTLVFVEP